MDVLLLDCGDDIKGECMLNGYKDKIELLSFSHGVAKQITGDQSSQTLTSGKPNRQDFTVTKHIDLATAKLIDYCNQAKPLATIKIIVGQNENGKVTPYLTYTMTNAIVSAISVSVEGHGKSTETVTINYSKIEWDYKPMHSSNL